MKIAIHDNPGGFSDRWINYCKEKNIDFKIVNCYATDIISQLKDCDIVMWHHSQGNPKEILIAKPILFALQHAGKIVFPDFNTNWHFDDKVGQKYLFEAIGASFVPTYTFYDKKEAVNWINKTDFPKVFKLRGGAGSANVKLARTRKDANKLIKKAFGKGFRQYEAWANLKERWRLYRLGKTDWWNLIKGIIRLSGYEPEFSKIIGWERGYIYFQDFIPNNNFDIRVIIIDDKAFAIKRMVRKNDFRASGSGNILYGKENFEDKTIHLAFKTAEKINGQSMAFDFIYDNGTPKIVEISYAFVNKVYDPCVGYWDKELNWSEGKFNHYGWMVELVIQKYRSQFS
jgi:glutathione synthase/RimK-type ligase-like ATP-grasp enzyme